LDGKVAFITGGGSGIGRGTAVLFGREGCKVAVAGRKAAAGEETLRLIREAGGEGLYVQTDVTEPDQVERAIKQTVAAFGGLDILFNNAGGSRPGDGRVTETPFEEFWATIRLDLFGTWLCCRYGIPELERRGGGSVINAVTFMALMGWPGRDAYSAAKGGIAALTRSMAVEYAASRIRVNAIAPGAIRTPRTAKLFDTVPALQPMIAKHLLGLGEPDDIGYMALYLASDESRITTGQIFAVDSGLTVS